MSTVFIKDQGKGFPVVFIHGFCETHEIWNAFTSELSSAYRVISVDLPGFGKSKLLKSPFSIDDVANEVTKHLGKLDVQTCIVIGHSLGGYVTLAMAEQAPQLLKGFGLFHSTSYADSVEKKLSRNKVIEFVVNNGVALFIQSFIPPLFYNQKAQYVSEVVAIATKTPLETLVEYTKVMRDRPDRTKTIEKFQGPILFIAGEKDGGIPIESIEKQVLKAKNGHLFKFKDVAHMGMYENKAGTFSKVFEFLQMVTSSGA